SPVDSQGRFRIWATPGFAFLYLRMSRTGSWDITVPEEGELEPLTLKGSSSGSPPGGMTFSATFSKPPQATKEKPVVGAVTKELKPEYGEAIYSQVIIYKSANAKPVSRASVRIYQDGHLLPNRETNHGSTVGWTGPVQDNQQVIAM